MKLSAGRARSAAQRSLAIAFAGLVAVSAGPAAAQVFSEFPVPTANSDLGGIAMGPDGAAWFVGGSQGG